MKPKRPVNVLLLGPTGAGKSSLINSILTTARERRVNDAYTGNKETSFTTAVSLTCGISHIVRADKI
jgi:predicted GTPase